MACFLAISTIAIIGNKYIHKSNLKKHHQVCPFLFKWALFTSLQKRAVDVHFHMTVLEIKQDCVIENQAMDRACTCLESQLHICFRMLLSPKRLSPERDSAEMLLSEALLENLFLKY